MSSRKSLAKTNLLKSVYIGGGMTVLVSALGLGISIPVYNSIKESLKKGISDLSDLSSRMFELISKLGVSPDASFEKELAGGFTILFENGKTKIYQTSHGGKTLVMNMNADHSVGSAAMKHGAAAQAMVEAINNAKQTFKTEVDALDDIMSEFAKDAEDESLETESAVSGLSITELKVRNALSGNPHESAVALAKLKEDGISDDAIKAAESVARKAIEDRKKAIIEAAKKKAALEHKMMIARAAGEAAVRREKEAQKKAKEEERALAIAKMRSFDQDILNRKMDRIKTWIKNHYPSTDLTKLITLEELTDAFNTLRQDEMKRKISDKQASVAQGNKGIIHNIATSTLRWLEFYVKVKNGYRNKKGQIGGKSSLSVDILKDILTKEKKLDPTKFDSLTARVDKILADYGGPEKAEFVFSDIINTYNENDPDVSRLNVIEMKIIYNTGTITSPINNERKVAILMKNSSVSSIGIDEFKIINDDNGAATATIQTAKAANSKLSSHLFQTLTKRLLKNVDSNVNFAALKDVPMGLQLKKFSENTMKIMDESEKLFTETILNNLAIKYFVDSKDIKLNASKLSKLIHKIYIKDESIASLSTSTTTSIYKLRRHKWMSVLDEVLTHENTIVIVDNALANTISFESFDIEEKDYLLHDDIFGEFIKKITKPVAEFAKIRDVFGLRNIYMDSATKNIVSGGVGAGKELNNFRTQIKTLIKDSKIETNYLGSIFKLTEKIIEWFPLKKDWAPFVKRIYNDAITKQIKDQEFSRISDLISFVDQIKNDDQIFGEFSKMMSKNNILLSSVLDLKKTLVLDPLQKQINLLKQSKNPTVKNSDASGSGIFTTGIEDKYGIKIKRPPLKEIEYRYVATGHEINVVAFIRTGTTDIISSTHASSIKFLTVEKIATNVIRDSVLSFVGTLGFGTADTQTLITNITNNFNGGMTDVQQKEILRYAILISKVTNNKTILLKVMNSLYFKNKIFTTTEINKIKELTSWITLVKDIDGMKTSIEAQMINSNLINLDLKILKTNLNNVLEKGLIKDESDRIKAYILSHSSTLTPETLTPETLDQATVENLGLGALLNIKLTDRESFIKVLKDAGNIFADDSEYHRLTHGVTLVKSGIEYYYKPGSRFFVNWKGKDKKTGIFQSLPTTSGISPKIFFFETETDSGYALTMLPRHIRGLPDGKGFAYKYTITKGVITVIVSIVDKTVVTVTGTI